MRRTESRVVGVEASAKKLSVLPTLYAEPCAALLAARMIGTSAPPDERLDLVGQVFEVGTSTEVER